MRFNSSPFSDRAAVCLELIGSKIFFLSHYFYKIKKTSMLKHLLILWLKKCKKKKKNQPMKSIYFLQ